MCLRGRAGHLSNQLDQEECRVSHSFQLRSNTQRSRLACENQREGRGTWWAASWHSNTLLLILQKDASLTSPIRLSKWTCQLGWFPQEQISSLFPLVPNAAPNISQDFPGGWDGKESACNAGDLGSIPGLERSPGRGHTNPTPIFLPGESPWTEEPGGPQSMGSQRVGHD